MGGGVFYPRRNTLFEEQQINGQRHRREDTHREKTDRRDTEEITEQITEDQPGPFRDTTSEGPSTL
jgi:hypothetical protein